MQFYSNNVRTDVFLDLKMSDRISLVVKIKILEAIYNQIGENGSQISWTERHEALFMPFCPKSKLIT
jgi:hypothetical protein